MASDVTAVLIDSVTLEMAAIYEPGSYSQLPESLFQVCESERCAASTSPRKGSAIVSTMLKSNHAVESAYDRIPESSPAILGIVPNEQASRGAVSSGEQATIGKGLIVQGEITGGESLFIDGKLEGSISLPGNRVTVGRNGKVEASINAREIIVMGKVRGNVTASDRVEIRAEGGVTGDVRAACVSIEDGAFFKGGIDIRKSERKTVHALHAALAPVSARIGA